MTEVPEYLLARSRERRAAMGGGGEAGGETASDAVAADAPVSTVPAPVAAAEFVPAEPPPPAPIPPFVDAAQLRKKMPIWVVPVMLMLPVWAIYYVGLLERPPSASTGLLGEGQQVYASSCAGCHGAGGGGGVGPQLNDGELLLTFPDLAGNVSWIINGSPAVNGTPYGDAARAGGQRTSAGGMPGWAGTLSPEELVGVVYYERLTHGGLDAETAALELELLEAFVATGTGFGGDETPGDIGSLFSELGGGEQATG